MKFEMTFSRKVFISVFLTSLLLCSILIWVAYHYVNKQTTESYISRYTVFSKVLGDTLSRLDTNTEALMLNAANYVALKDSNVGLLSTEDLKKMRDQLSVTHIFVTDKYGKFLRSTNEDPTLIPNVFSFCPEYKNLVVGSETQAATPVVHPQPEPRPYKFLLAPTPNRERLIEVGVRVDFIAKTLSEALGSDVNLTSMSLYAPDGTPFGRFKSDKVEFSGDRASLPESFPKFINTGDNFKFFTKVTSSHPHCCQCDISGTSRNGNITMCSSQKFQKKNLQYFKPQPRDRFSF